MLAAGEAPRPGRSRIKGLQSLVAPLLRIHKAAALFCAYRAASEAQHAVAAKIEERVRASLADLNALDLPPDPRVVRRARKTPHPRTSR